jgi:predicted glycosyltransferase
LPIPTEDVADTLTAYEPTTSAEDIRHYCAQMQEQYTSLVVVHSMSEGEAEQTVRALYLEELDAAVAQREDDEDAEDWVDDITWEDIEDLTVQEIMNRCESAEQFDRICEKLC